MSSSGEVAWMCVSGKAAPPTTKSGYSSRRSSISSSEYSRPPSVFVQRSWPCGGSPRSARTFSTPASRIRSRVPRRSSRVALTQVKCAIASMPKSSLSEATMSMVVSRVVPPAP